MVAVEEIVKYSNTAPRCNGHTYFDPMDPFVTKLTKYCAKILSGNEDEWWIGFLIRIRRGLVLTQYEGGPGAVYYSDTELYYQNLVNKFVEKPSGDNNWINGGFFVLNYNYFLSVFFPESELKILPYNRVVKSLDLSIDDFRTQLSEVFSIEANGISTPRRQGEICMYFEGIWNTLTLRDTAQEDDPVASLDVSILQDKILSPILNIGDPRESENIDFNFSSRLL